MNVPNLLTLLRIFIVPLLVAALVQENMRLDLMGFSIPQEFLALSIFLIAATTDLLDGYLARRWKQVTTVGTLLDPIADKLLISAALISLVQVRLIPGWMAILIISREFAVTGLRAIAATEGYTIQASDLAKTKTATQVIAISLILLSIHWSAMKPCAQFAMWVVVFFGVTSAVDYFHKFWRKVDSGTKQRGRRELIVAARRRRKEIRAMAAAAHSAQSSEN